MGMVTMGGELGDLRLKRRDLPVLGVHAGDRKSVV